MPIQTSGKASSGELTKYEAKYTLGAVSQKTYDQFATPVGKTFEPQGSTVQRAWLQKAQPRPTTAVANENMDFEPQTLRDSSNTMTLAYLSDGLKAHQLAFLKSSLLTPASLSKAVGELAMETIDAKARRAATEGNLVGYGGSTQGLTRVTLDLGTAAHRMIIDNFTIARAILGSWLKDDGLFVVMDNFQYSDLMITASGVVTNSMVYTEKGLEKLYNYELGELLGIRIIVSPHAKAFYGAGVANAAPVATTIATSTTANIAGSRTIEVAANTNMAVGMWLTVGTVQTAAETDDTAISEIVRVATVGATTITIVGAGAGGGLKYDHAVGAAVANGDTAHCAIFGNKQSLDVAFEGFGRYGKLVPPFEDGNAKQWTTASFNYYGGYAVLDQSGLFRAETSASLQ
jgi:hypothetical protein